MGYTKSWGKGFSLVEVMIVVLIIGIFSAVAVPGILEIRYRNTLTDSVERVRSAGQATRDLAMQTRNAVVMEVTATTMWVNILNGPSCTGDIRTNGRCTGSVADANGVVTLFATGDEEIGDTAGVALCGGIALAGDDDGDCGVGATLNIANGFALCYSGRGELWYRLGSDDNTTCDADLAPDGNMEWVRSCAVDPASDFAAVTLPDGSTTALTEGAILMLNRYDGASCDQSNEMDVKRFVTFPTNGAPFSRL